MLRLKILFEILLYNSKFISEITLEKHQGGRNFPEDRCPLILSKNQKSAKRTAINLIKKHIKN